MRIVEQFMKSQSSWPRNLLILLGIITLAISLASCKDQDTPELFNAERAFEDLKYQVELGPRVVGSLAHTKVRAWLLETGEGGTWVVEEQATQYLGQPIFNIVARRDSNADDPWIIIGAHYDSRKYADKDPDPGSRDYPVPGANDGASGVAVLRELARVIPVYLQANIWLVFFDAEDNGSLPGGEWILGSRAFVESLEGIPDAVVILDMVGDTDLNIHVEKNSDANLVQEIWGIAKSLGYNEEFIDLPKHRLIDDHLPFIQAGIPAVDIIDFDYPYWHTTADTIDKVSPQSLRVVGEVVLALLIDKYG